MLSQMLSTISARVVGTCRDSLEAAQQDQGGEDAYSWVEYTKGKVKAAISASLDPDLHFATAVVAVMSEPVDFLSMHLQHCDHASCTLDELFHGEGLNQRIGHLYFVMHPGHARTPERPRW